MSTDNSKQDHWSKILYGPFAGLYLPILQSREEGGSREVERILDILTDLGVIGRVKILDLACGIGRHSIALAKLGFEVVGIDISPLFLDIARKRATEEKLDERRVRFVQGDIRQTASLLSSIHEEGFAVILNLFGCLGSYGEEEDVKLIHSLRAVSKPDCILMVEIVNRDFLVKRFQPFGIRRISSSVRLFNLARFNLENSTLEDDWRFYIEMPDGNLKLELAIQISGRVYTLLELKKLVREAGWDYVKNFGSMLSPGPVTIESPSIVLVCRNKHE